MNVSKIININILFIFIVILLSLIGMAALYSAGGSFDPWAKKHIIRFSISQILLFLVSIIDIKYIYKYSYSLFFLTLLLLFSVEIFEFLEKGLRDGYKFLE